ncbi:MAG: CDC27 family protein [Bacteroidota bacterium]
MKFILSTILLASSSVVFSQKCENCQDLYDAKEYEQVIENVAQTVEKADYKDLVLLAKSYQNLGMKKDAIEAYNYILLNDENNVDALVAVGALFIDLKQYENALFATERALKFDEANKNAIYNISVIHLRQNKYELFHETSDKQLDMNPLNKDFLYLKAIFYLEDKDYEKASEYFDRILKLGPSGKDEPNYEFYYGYAAFKLNNLGLAKEKLMKAVEIQSEELIEAYYFLAQVHVKLENKIEACEAYTKAINLGDIALTKEADAYCEGEKSKKSKFTERLVRISF